MEATEQTTVKNGVWPYRIKESDRITYFNNVDSAVAYLETLEGGHIEVYDLPRWKELGDEDTE